MSSFRFSSVNRASLGADGADSVAVAGQVLDWWITSTAARISAKDLERLARALTNPITETYATDRVLSPERFAYAIEIVSSFG